MYKYEYKKYSDKIFNLGNNSILRRDNNFRYPTAVSAF